MLKFLMSQSDKSRLNFHFKAILLPCFASVFFFSTHMQAQSPGWGNTPSGWDDFKIGLVNDNSAIINTRTKKALEEGVKLHYRYIYVNNGADPTNNSLTWLFTPWGDYSKNSLDMGLRPAYVIYMLQEEGGAPALKQHILDANFMRNYFSSIRIVAEKSRGMKAIFVIEPDTWGYFLQNALEQQLESDPRNIPAAINNLGAGYEHLAGLPNSLSGVAQGVIRTIRKYAPDAYCGVLMSFWSVNGNGATGPAVPDGNKGMVYWNQGDVEFSAKRNADFAKQLLGTGSDRGDFIGVEKNGWSAGNWYVKQNRRDYYWNDTQNAKWVSWSKTLGQQVNLPLLGWQISIGHMGLPNTVNRYEDTFMPYFFTHTQEFMNAGFIGFLAGKGLADCTDYTNANGNASEPNGSAGDNGWFLEQLKAFDTHRPYLNGHTNNPAPTVSITSPVSGATFTTGQTITINATASDNGSITKVEFYADGTKLGEDATSPYTFTWTGATAGNHSLTSKATDNQGAITTSSEVSISVNNSNVGTIPGTIQSEAYSAMNGIQTETTTDTGGGLHVGRAEAGDWLDYSVNVTQSGSYTVGFRVASESGNGQFQILSGNTNLATVDVNATGGMQNWTTLTQTITLPGGNQTLRLQVVKGGFNINWMQFATGNSNQAPIVSLTTPANDAIYTAPASITLTATATDADGTIARVEFYRGTIQIGKVSTEPYSLTDSDVAAGTYTYSAKAFDNTGASTTSTSVSVTVSKPNSTGCAGIATYRENGGYVAGSRVTNGITIYECKPYPFTNWCNSSAWAYEPGTGLYWQDAWVLVGPCSSTAKKNPVSSDVRDSEVAVYPNPVLAGESLQLVLETVYPIVKVSAISLNGGKIYNFTYKNAQHITVDTSSLPKGAYVFKIETGLTVLTKKVIKQ
jgi:hypothetical protein